MALLQDGLWPALLRDDDPDDSGCGTVVYANGNVSSQSTCIASCILELEKMGQDLESKLRNDYNTILDSMDTFSLSPTPQPSSPPTRTASSVHSPFTVAAYSWLLDNIANPYPPSTVKTSLAQEHDCPLSAVNSWFVNARRRMGWTALCRDHFNNCRADALDAAHRALVHEDPNRPLSPDVVHAFIGVKVAAEGLYSSIFTKSALAGVLDAVVRDMTDPDTTTEGERSHDQFKGMVESPVPPEPSETYSSDSSCSSSPVPALVPSLTDDSEEDEEVSPPILVGRKRRLSCSEPAQDTTTTSTPKRRKQFCGDLTSLFETYLSSPQVSEGHVQHQPLSSIQISEDVTDVSTSRKRRLSDASTTGIQKRPRESIATPRPQAVLDPLPLSTLESDHAIDEWFSSNFDALFALPPPVDVIEPDLTAQWEVELFKNYNIPEEAQQPPLRSFDHTPCDLPLTQADLSELDDFFRSLEGGQSAPPPEITDSAIMVPTSDLAPQESSQESVDWDSLFNMQPSEPSLDSFFVSPHTSSLPVPEIDTSVLQLA